MVIIKKYICMALIFAVLLVLVPIVFPLVSGTSFFNPLKKQSFTLELTESGEVVEISAVDYLTGCLYAQVRIDYEPELLKAQACAAYTYALRIVENSRRFPQSKPAKSDLTDNSATCQAYFTPEAAKAYYGDDYGEYYDKIRAAAEYGANNVILYENEPIYAVYHSVSTGSTNTGYNVWGVDYDYLLSVESACDKEFSYFECTNAVAYDKVRQALLNYNGAIKMPLDYSKWFTDANIDENGYLVSVSAGDNVLSGGDLWRIFRLRSTAVSISYDDGIFTFVTKGYGHGVGLSQYGGNEMAKSGAGAEEILLYYYSGVTIA